MPLALFGPLSSNLCPRQGPLVSERRDRNDGGLFSLIYLELLVGVGWYVP